MEKGKELGRRSALQALFVVTGGSVLGMVMAPPQRPTPRSCAAAWAIRFVSSPGG